MLGRTFAQMTPKPESRRSRARALLFLWSAPAIAVIVTLAVSVLCCVTPLHGFIHQERGMQACNHEAQQVDARDSGDSPFSRPPSFVQVRSDLEQCQVITRSKLNLPYQVGDVPELRFFDTGPPAPDAPTQARLAVFRI